MSASNGGLQSEVNNYFNTLQASFPYPIEGKLDTVQFLDAAKGVVSLIDMFGKVFIAVRYDMNGNIEKLTRVYESDKERFKYLHDMILCESKGGGVVATDALLWLIRGLHLFQRFFELILSKNQPQNEGDSDDLSPLLKTAYEETLCCHHGWMAQQFFKVPLIEVEHLEQHQEAILKQLALLKEQMAAFRIELSQQASIPPTSISRTKSASCSSTSSKPVTWNGLIHDIVVNASPNYPPHSLLAVGKLWSDVLNLQITCYTHSTVISPPSHLAHFHSNNNGAKHTGQSKLNVSLIWKDMGPDCEVIMSPLNQLALRGEVNLIRYLHHTLYPPADAITETKLDNLLDICHRLIHARTVKEKQSLVRAINASLGKSTWLGGDTMDVADIAAWSALQNTGNIELTQNMTKWQERCKNAIGLCCA